MLWQNWQHWEAETHNHVGHLSRELVPHHCESQHFRLEVHFPTICLNESHIQMQCEDKYHWCHLLNLLVNFFVRWIYPSKCKHTLWTGSLLHKPDSKSVHSRLGNCTCNFKLRIWGRLNYLDGLVEQHNPNHTMHSITCSGRTDLSAGVQCSAGLWAPTL